MRRILSALFIVAVFSLLIGCGKNENNPYVPWPSTGDTIHVVFQFGTSPFPDYYGTKDAILKDSPGAGYKNYNYGNVPFDTIGFARIGGLLYERRLIIAFDLSAIKNCSRVIEARLRLSLDPLTQNGLFLTAHSVSMPNWTGAGWVEGINGSGNGVSWLTIDGGVLWHNPGGDFDQAPLDTSYVMNDTVATFDLPGSLVLDWIAHPDANHGIIVRPLDTGAENACLIFMKESDNAALRPLLEVTYIKGG
ncbi:MAG: hypothetical protein B6D63_04355 [Candidatus Latescibacteria bacterium 4484_7]|nr:MAG: hypothetical protein B6D63_04355 [Candidatus Latescibacteria bacterium 4484_7]